MRLYKTPIDPYNTKPNLQYIKYYKCKSKMLTQNSI